jgi:small GTP-binding protein
MPLKSLLSDNNNVSNPVLQLDQFGETPKIQCAHFIDCPRLTNLQLMNLVKQSKQLNELGIDERQLLDYYQQSDLVMAAGMGQLTELQNLLKSFDPAKNYNKEKNILLLTAVFTGRLAIVQYLIENSELLSKIPSSSNSEIIESRKYECDYGIVQVGMLGNTYAGKTTLLDRYINNKFNLSIKASIGVNYENKILTMYGKRFLLRMWDIPGRERVRFLSEPYFKFWYAILVLSSVTNWNMQTKQTEEEERDINYFVNQRNQLSPQAPIILVGAQTDFRTTKKSSISYLEGEALAKKIGAVNYMECSAKTGEGIEGLFEAIAKQAIDRYLHIHFLIPLLIAARNNHFAVVRYLLESIGPDIFESVCVGLTGQDASESACLGFLANAEKSYTLVSQFWESHKIGNNAINNNQTIDEICRKLEESSYPHIAELIRTFTRSLAEPRIQLSASRYSHFNSVHAREDNDVLESSQPSTSKRMQLISVDNVITQIEQKLQK